MKKEKLVVIGNGMAGARFVEEVLARGGRDRFDITMFGAEPHGNYNRILLSAVLSGQQRPEEIFINPLEWYAENGVTLHAGSPIERVDPEAKVVVAADGRTTSYDKLVFATGSRPFIPPMAGVYTDSGVLKAGAFVFRTIDDCARIAEGARSARRVAVIGGGLLGLEAARGLLTHGPEVHVVHLAPHLMEVQLDPPAGELLRRTMTKLGVQVHLEKATTEVLGEDRVTGLRFKDGSTLDCDLVVISCGIAPNVELARAAGLATERGLVVDDRLMSPTDPSVFAVGECAQHRGKLYGLVAPLWEQAQVLADHLTGANPEARYEGSKLATKLKVMGVELASMGDRDPRDEHDEVIQYSEPGRGI